MALLATACGDDDDGQEATATSAAVAESAGTAATGTTAATMGTSAGAGGGAATSSPAGAPGQVTPDNPSGFGTSRLSGQGPYGQDPNNENIYRGAGGLQIDLNDCPSDYDPMQGITDDEIKLGVSLPRSGPIASFGLLADGLQSYFRYVNEELGGIDGRQIVVDVKDDAYEANRTKTNVDEMLQSGDYAAFVMILGTPHNLAIWDETNKECMPHLMNGTGAIEWGDVENHPWTTGMQLDYNTEPALWARFIQTKFPNGARVAGITFNSEFGKSVSAGFRKAIEGTNIELVAEELHDPTAPNLTNNFTNLAATNADVLLIMTSGVFCTQAMAEVEKSPWDPMVIMYTPCSVLSQFFQPLTDQGLTGKDTYVLQYQKDPNDPAFAGDPFIDFYRKTVAGYGLDPTQTTYFTGWIFGWFMSEFLHLASQMEGGLSRPNILIANRSIDSHFPGMLDGVTNRMEGFDDAYLNEAARMVQYKVSDASQLGTYVSVSDLFNNEGQLGNYSDITG